MAVGRDALIPPHPAPPQTPAGGINPSPTNQRRARGQPGNRKPCGRTTPCRGRFHIGPACAAANTPGGYRIRPYNGFPAPETRGFPGICGTYKTTVGRDALIPPHPAPPQPPPRCGVHKRAPCNTRQTLPNTIKSAGPIRKQTAKIMLSYRTRANFPTDFPSRPQGGDPPYLNSKLSTLNSQKLLTEHSSPPACAWRSARRAPSRRHRRTRPTTCWQCPPRPAAETAP